MTTTRFEDTAGAQWTTLDDEGPFFDSLALSGRATVQTLTLTPQLSRPIRLVEIALPGTPANAPRLLLVGVQHGNEPAGREAILSLVRDLAESSDPDVLNLLNGVRVYAIPTANPEGFLSGRAIPGSNVDLNRDHLDLASVESRTLQRAITDLDPDLIVDCHERPVEFPVRWRVELLTLGHPAAMPDVADVSSAALADMQQALDAQDIAHAPYPSTSTDPRILRVMASLRNCPIVLVETPGYEGEVPRTLRAEWHGVTTRGALAWLVSNGTAAKSARLAAAQAAIAQGQARASVNLGGATLTSPPIGYRMTGPPPAHLDTYGIEYTEDGGTVTVMAAQPQRGLVHLLFDAASDVRLFEATPILPPPPAPKFRGRLLWRNNVMATRENIKWLKTDLHTCGLDLDKLSELPSNLEKLINVKLEITKRTRGENENVYINRRIVLEDGGDEYDSAARNALAPF